MDWAGCGTSFFCLIFFVIGLVTLSYTLTAFEIPYVSNCFVPGIAFLFKYYPYTKMVLEISFNFIK
jgi:hypothetical protein